MGITTNIKNWVNKKIAMLSLAMGNVEKNTFSQSGEVLSTDFNQTQRHTQGQLADSLKQGEITQEVMNLRWRTYKILKETEGVTAEIVGYDENNMPIVKTRKRNKKLGLKKVKLDPYDNNKLEMVIDNSEIMIGGNQAMANDNISILDEVEKSQNEYGDLIVTHGVINSLEYFATNKAERPIIITRTELPNFNIENFTLKLNVRIINETDKLLEFYVSKYPDEYNRTSRLFISEVNKIMCDDIKSSMLNFESVNFITYKTLGADDFLEYEYTDITFDKIVEYNGYYIIKFTSKIKIDGKNILENYRVDELDKKYDKKEKK
jgi:hypothetical protein